MSEEQSNSQWSSKSGLPHYKFPEVLLRPPRCLIALSGLDVTNNAVHRLVWEEFSSGARRTDRKPILFKNFPANYLYPKCGPNQTTYEDYSLQGILKNSWLHKHCEELPALVAFFFDLDWNDPQWDEKQTECVSKVEVIRSALQNRATEIVIVLLQSNPPLPVGEASNINSERAAALCVACELPRLNLFVLPFTQRPQGFISKIEEAFYKKAILYYANKIHATRAHKDMATNKQSLQLLFIRHNFKMAFFAEMKQEPATALKLYRVAYTHLLENMYLSDDRIMEFKMVSGFISYKICRLCFERDEPVDSISQFRRHIDRFSNERGFKQLAYEHYEWLSRQFSAFADLFSEAIRRGLKGLQTQNPGLYYHQAALYALKRKQIANQLTIDQKSTELLPSLPQIVYYGQRPWRKSLTDDKPSNMELRQRCILTLQNHEKSTEHSWQIIPLLTQAISHLKNYGCDRMITFLKILTADEYYQVKDYEKSYVLLNGVVEVYRTEQWWDNLMAILLRILRYAYILGYVQEYVTVGLEIISRYFPIAIEEKKRIQSNIAEVFSNQCPLPEVGLSSEVLQQANVKWAEFWQRQQSKPFVIQLSSLASCVECKTVFTKASFMADELVEIMVYLQSSAPLSLNISRLMIRFVKEEYNPMCIHDGSFLLEPNVLKTFTFSFPSFPSSVNTIIEVYAVEALLKYGSGDTPTSPNLIWSNGASETFISQPSDFVWQKIEHRKLAMIRPRSPHISISLNHSNPALTEEYYDVTVSVTNQELTPITNLFIKLSLPESLDESQPPVEIYEFIPTTTSSNTSVSLPQCQLERQSSLEMTCPHLDENGGVFKKKFFLCAHCTGARKIDVSVNYEIACHFNEKWEPVNCLCQKNHSEMLKIVNPFNMAYKLMTTKFRLTDYVSYNSPFILMIEVSCTSPWPLHISESKFEPSNAVHVVGENFSQVEGLEMDPKDRATECYCLLTMNNYSSNVSLGNYTAKWRRSTNLSSVVLTSTVSFPPVTAKYQAYNISADIPANGLYLELLPVSYTVHNKSALVQEFEVKMGASDAFMYSGNRISKFRILPSSKHTLTYNLLPVITGQVTLPVMEITCQRDTEKGVDPLFSDSVPTSILIKPSPTSKERGVTLL